jgi:methylenetetrahydrofolate dehydrogenase (NADP+)/methenyltetrahydrofolate cyclohydrolase
MQLLDGKKTAEDKRKSKYKRWKIMGESPHLAAVMGNDGASLTYVGSKVKACQRVGFESTLVKLPVLPLKPNCWKIKELNEDDNIDGFIVHYRFRNKLMSKSIDGC